MLSDSAKDYGFDPVIYLEDKFIRPILVRALSKSIDQVAKPITVFARTACVGNLILAKTFRKGRLNKIHAQKARVDFLSQKLSNFSAIEFVDVNEVSYFNANSREWHNQLQNEQLIRKFFTADFSIFDSFCELTDNKFVFKYKDIEFSGYGHFSDFNAKNLEPNLIDIQSVEKSFLNLITHKLELESNFPIIWLHYSAKNDSREFYVRRSNDLLDVANSLESRYPFFHVLKLDNTDYHYSESDFYPYHYGRKTTDYLAQKLRDILRKNNVPTSKYVYRI